MDRGAGPPGRFAELPEIDVGADIGLPGGFEHFVPLVPADGLQGLPRGAVTGAIVDDKRGPAVPCDAGADGLGQGKPGGRHLAHGAQGSAAKTVRKGMGVRGRAKHETKFVARRAGIDQALAPAAARPLELADGQRIEQLVRNEQKRRVRHAVEIVVPGDVATRERGALLLAQRWARLHQVQARRLDESRRSCGGAQGVRHQRSPARTEFGEDHGVGPAHDVPYRGAPQADQLAKHLAYFGRGDEIAASPDRIAGHVVAQPGMAHRLRHIAGD